MRGDIWFLKEFRCYLKGLPALLLGDAIALTNLLTGGKITLDDVTIKQKVV